MGSGRRRDSDGGRSERARPARRRLNATSASIDAERSCTLALECVTLARCAVASDGSGERASRARSGWRRANARSVPEPRRRAATSNSPFASIERGLVLISFHGDRPNAPSRSRAGRRVRRRRLAVTGWPLSGSRANAAPAHGYAVGRPAPRRVDRSFDTTRHDDVIARGNIRRSGASDEKLRRRIFTRHRESGQKLPTGCHDLYES